MAVPFGGKATQSGFYLPAGPSEAAGVRADELMAAQFFPDVDGATVLHVHFADGGFLVGGGTLTPEQFKEQVIDGLNLEPRQPLILVACQTAAASAAMGQGVAASELASLSDRPVIAATGDAFTTPKAQVVTTHSGVDAGGYPVVDAGPPADWVIAWPDGTLSPGLGPDLLAILDGKTLARDLPGVAIREGEPVGPPRRPVKWSRETGNETAPSELSRHLDDMDARLEEIVSRGAQLNITTLAGADLSELEERVRDYRGGIGLAELTEPRRAEMLWRLLDGPDSALRAALGLISAESDPVLGRLFADRALFTTLTSRIPDGNALRPDLRRLVAARFRGGWAALDRGEVEPLGQPDGTFGLGQISSGLASIDVHAELSGDDLGAIAAALAGLSSDQLAKLGGALVGLPLPQRALGTSVLAGIRAALIARAGRATGRGARPCGGLTASSRHCAGLRAGGSPDSDRRAKSRCSRPRRHRHRPTANQKARRQKARRLSR